MRVTILGSGTCIPTVDRGPPGVLVRTSGPTALVDLGPGILRRLPAEGLNLGDIDVVLLTHFHTDHAADLAPLLFALKNPLYSGRGDLRIIGAPGLRDLHASLEATWGAWIRPTEFRWTLEEVGPGEEIDLGGGVVGRTTAVEHTPASQAWGLVEPDGATAVISGDSGPCEGVVEAGRGADLYVLECAFPDGNETPYHLTPSEVGRIAAEAAPGHLCLTHFYPEMEGQDIEGAVRTSWAGPLSLAVDGLSFRVERGAVEVVG